MEKVDSDPQDEIDLAEPESSRAKILRAAVSEFAARGFAGARMESIARLADLNKALVYRHFKSKEGLFDKALRFKFAGRYRVADAVPASLAKALEYWFRHSTDDPEFMTLLHQEAMKPERIVHEAFRALYYERQLQDVAQRQGKGQIDKRLDTRMTLLALSALVMFPALFPQMTKLISGRLPSDPLFKDEWSRFLRQLARRLKTS